MTKQKFVIYSPNESASNRDAGYWSNHAGWTTIDQATLFDWLPDSMPTSVGNDARVLVYSHAPHAEVLHG